MKMACLVHALLRLPKLAMLSSIQVGMSLAQEHN
jgi:hypothetical protein